MNHSPAVIAVPPVRLPPAVSVLGCTPTRGYFASAPTSKTGVATNRMPSLTSFGSAAAGPVGAGGGGTVGVPVEAGAGLAGAAAGWRWLSSSNRPCAPFHTPTRVPHMLVA